MVRDLFNQTEYEAVKVLETVSHLMRDLRSPKDLDLAGRTREALAVFHHNLDLISISAHPEGSNTTLDQAIRCQEPLKRLLRQDVTERSATHELATSDRSRGGPRHYSPIQQTQH